jgi:chromosome segregation ATPase
MTSCLNGRTVNAMMAYISPLLDVLLLVLLGITIRYALRLQKKLEKLEKCYEELPLQTQPFTRALSDAQLALGAYKADLEKTVADVSGLLNRARKTMDDLEFLHERGEGIANRLENTVRQPSSPSGTAFASASKAEQELRQALRGS